MGTLATDVRYGIRMLLRTPMLSAVAVLTIALGIGLTSHTFAVVYGSVMRGLPVRDPDRLVVVRETDLEVSGSSMSIPVHDWIVFRDQQTSFEELASGYNGTVNIAGLDGPPVRFSGGFMSANALRMLGVPPLHGRTFESGEDRPGAAPTLILGYDAWRNQFGADPEVVGTSVRVNGEPATIIGVMPQGFHFPFAEDVWVTHRFDPEAVPRRQGNSVEVMGYLREGVSLDAANAEVAAIAERIAEEFPESNEGIGAVAMPYVDGFMPQEITLVIYLMLGAVLGVLLIACANVANLLLARAAIRQREVAVRTALGANRWRVVRQLLAESLVLSVIGGALGFALAWAITLAFNASIVDIQKPYWIDIRLDAPIWLFTGGITLFAAVFAGTMPALRASGADFGNLLRDESRGSSSLRLGRLSSALVVTELALSCALLIAAGFMIRSIINANAVELGFDPDPVLTARVALFEQDYPDQQARDQFFQRLLDRLREEPGIEAAALSATLPAAGRTGLIRWPVAIEGESYATDADYPVVNGAYVTDGFFRSFGIEILQGRDFRPSESWTETEPVAIVNQSFVDTYVPRGDPLGRRVRIGRSESENPWMRIVGVVPDVRVSDGVGGIGDDQLTPEGIYTTVAAYDPQFISMVMRTQGLPQSMARAARQLVADLDPNLPIYWVYTMNEVVADSTWAYDIFGSTFTLFGAAALFLAAVGIYGVMSFSVAQRRQEMGVRMALGAESGDIYRMIFRRVLLQLAVGLTLGLALGFALAQPLRAVMYGIDPNEAGVYVAIIGTLVASGILATLFPAVRATRVDPVTALRPS